MSVTAITTRSEFEQLVLQSKKTVLVDFWAEWCPPCRAMAPILEQVAKDNQASLEVIKVDIEASKDNAELANEHGVQGIPNMLVFKDRKVVENLVGMRSAAVLQSELKSHLSE